MKNLIQERNEAITDFILYDDLTKYHAYCRRYKIPMPSSERVLKASICKAAQECLGIPKETKELAKKKCIELGFKPSMFE
jgi:hypothetical protein